MNYGKYSTRTERESISLNGTILTGSHNFYGILRYMEKHHMGDYMEIIVLLKWVVGLGVCETNLTPFNHAHSDNVIYSSHQDSFFIVKRPSLSNTSPKKFNIRYMIRPMLITIY
jgi:hypothetical protein